MAATGFTPIWLYASGTAGHIPLAANLTNTTNGSEIALNYADGNLFFKNASNSVITTPLLQSSGSQNGWLSSTDWTTFNGKQAALVSGTNIKTVSGTSLLGSGDLGTIGTGYGGTGLTSFTNHGILYASSTSALATSSALTFDGTNFATTGTISALMLTAGNNADVLVGRYDATYPTSGAGYFKLKTTNNDGTTGGVIVQTLQAGTLRDSYKISEFGSGTSAHYWYSGGSEAMRLLTSQNLQFSTAAGGIYFNSGSSSLLNDYEEGTWTPTLLGSTTDPTVSYSTQSGYYVKIGKSVFVAIRIVTTAVSGGSGALLIGGLPYQVGNLTCGIDRAFVYNWTNDVKTFAATSNQNYITVYKNDFTNTAASPADLGSNSYITISGTYYVN